MDDTVEAEGKSLIKLAVASACPVQPIQAPGARESFNGKCAIFNIGKPKISVNTPVNDTIQQQ